MSVSEAARPVPDSPAPTRRGGPGGKTQRRDRWWLQPLVTVVVLVGFIAYSTWSAFTNHDYYTDPYLSPFFSPCVAKSCPPDVRWLSINLMRWISPAIYILVFPLGFRLTCYYYRKAYYRSFWQSPPGCAVAEPHKGYSGETRLPLILQNLHRYFLYFAVIVNVILFYDAVKAFDFPAAGTRSGGWGIGVGSLVLFVNAVLLAIYTASCHSCRHLIGGRINHFSKHPVRYKLWGFVSRLNPHHPKFAWISLFGVALTDAYVRLVATHTITDVRFF
jgi:hypothetical protein